MESVIHIINGQSALKFLDLKRRVIVWLSLSWSGLFLTGSLFAGLIDTDGSIIFNYPWIRIVQFRTQVQSILKNLVLDFVDNINQVSISDWKNQTKGKVFQSIAFKYQLWMVIFLYDYLWHTGFIATWNFYRIKPESNCFRNSKY
jgi:hypothetical protein